MESVIPGSSRVAAVLLAALSAPAADLVFATAVELAREGEVVVVRNDRDRRELLVSAGHIVAVVPADEEDNNATTAIVLAGGADAIRFQQRTNPASRIVAALAGMGLGLVEAADDRDVRKPRRYLLNPARVATVERTRTDYERSDTVIIYDAGAAAGRITVNQSAAAYRELRERIARSRR